ncbi:hypothetical protein BTVI_08570 [Pitangus sulphuratus]|nr:hypothetical protein BTVI_08570 [Pitangus sulphuratus]
MIESSFRLDNRKKFFAVGVVRHRHKLPREAVAAPSLEVFKIFTEDILATQSSEKLHQQNLGKAEKQAVSTPHYQGNAWRKGRVEASDFWQQGKGSCPPQDLQLQDGFTSIKAEGETDRYYHWFRWVQPWPAVGLSQSQLALAMGHGGSFQQLHTEATPVAPPPTTETWPCKPKTWHVMTSLYLGDTRTCLQDKQRTRVEKAWQEHFSREAHQQGNSVSCELISEPFQCTGLPPFFSPQWSLTWSHYHASSPSSKMQQKPRRTGRMKSKDLTWRAINLAHLSFMM